MVHMVTSLISIVTVCYQLEFLSDLLTMLRLKSFTSMLTSFFRRKQDGNRGQLYDPDLGHRRSWFLKFYSPLGCITIPNLPTQVLGARVRTRDTTGPIMDVTCSPYQIVMIACFSFVLALTTLSLLHPSVNILCAMIFMNNQFANFFSI